MYIPQFHGPRPVSLGYRPGYGFRVYSQFAGAHLVLDGGRVVQYGFWGGGSRYKHWRQDHR